MKKEKMQSFSYLDIFLILVLFLVLSFAVYHFTENSRQKESIPDLFVSLSAYADSEMDIFPKKGEALYAESGDIYGLVEEVEVEDTGRSKLIRITCKMQGVQVQIGDEMKIETPSGVRTMRVFSIEETLNSAKGEP